MHEFTFSDLARVQWLSTLKLMLARGFCAGIVWAVITSFGAAAPELETQITWPFVWAIVALPLALFFQFVGMILGAFASSLGVFVSLVGALFVCAGDPLVYLFNRAIPRILNIADIAFFNLQPIIFITNPD